METCWGDGGGHSSSQPDAPSQRRQPSKAQKSCPRPGAPRAAHRTAPHRVSGSPRLRAPAEPSLAAGSGPVREVWAGPKRGTDGMHWRSRGWGRCAPRRGSGTHPVRFPSGAPSGTSLGSTSDPVLRAPAPAHPQLQPLSGLLLATGPSCARSAEFRGLPPWFLGSAPRARPLDFSM